MNIEEFEKRLNDVRINNGWTIELEFNGLWIINIFDKDSGEKIANTGATGLNAVIYALENPITPNLWYIHNEKNDYKWESK